MGNLDTSPATAQNLALALNALESVQTVIRRADAKATLIAGSQISLTIGAIDSLDSASPVWTSSGAPHIAGLFFAALFLTSLAASAVLLGAAVWPRLDQHESRFGFPSLAIRTEPPPSTGEDPGEDAWRLTVRLSGTARRKYQLIRWALPASGGTFFGIAGWLCLAHLVQ